METGKLFMTTVTVTEMINMRVLEEEEDMMVIIVNAAVIMIGIMTMIVIEIQGTDMGHIQRDPGGNLDLDHGPGPLLNQKEKGPLVLTWHHLLRVLHPLFQKAMFGCMFYQPIYQRTPCSIFNGWLVHSVAGPFILNWQKLPIGQMPGIAHTIQGATHNFSPYGMSQATRHARRVYVGGLPPFANEQAIASFFSHVMIAIGGNSAGSGDSVVNVYINHEKKFAFVEMRTVEEASNAMALDGIVFEGVAVRVRRPTDYNPSLAAALGPCQPSANLNLSAVGLTAGTIGGAEGLDRIFVGGLPYYFTEAQMRELLQAFGPLRNFDIVRDKETGNSKGYGFCIYQDPAVTDIACASLNGLKMGDKTLTVRRATVSGHSKPEEDNIFARAQQHIAMQKIALEVVGLNIPGVERGPSNEESPTKVVCLTQAVTTEQLNDNGEYEEILEDMRDECCKFGTLMNVVIPRPNPNGELSAGIGKVFLEYSECSSSLAAKNALNGRKFGGNIVTAVYYPEEKYHSMEYDL
ncbi:splicing factor U2af large subunit B isoform X4 [Lathyrus oleraceus]|uniref:splicing factor U2af large subunit B isoform X4 n=1 Tax=Pisum sativum TaxID=3888 RepID=UPI0021CEBF9F|nr:splicing factor U2af large subunit B-like isoform X4 [Pisum sativum]